MRSNTNFGIVFKLLGGIILFFALISCEDRLMERVSVYSEDFSQSDSNSRISNAKWHEFNGDTVLGWFHNEEITLDLKDLPEHNTVEVTVEVLLHDSWDGNADNAGGPDFWYLHLDGEEIINATFSNSPCGSNYCLYQSFPENYPRAFDPKTGALEIDLPGRCQYKGVAGWTSKYRITRLVKHNNQNLLLQIGDRLKQENSPIPQCDESWSLSKLEISTLQVN